MTASGPPSVDLQEGRMLAGKYRIERVLGRGGMGVVIRAKHVTLDEHVAIKLMLPEVAQNADAVARFTREARAAAKIKSEHVVRVSDVAVLEDGSPYMVMEYLEGRDLESLLHERKRLPAEEALEYVLQACEAIAEAHALGIVHRDLKPANLFLGRRRDGSPIVKVLDFGISKLLSATGGSDGAVTRTAALMGSPLYMSPEQMASSRDVDGRSDIWALGVILFELLSGTQPFTGETLPQVCARVIEAKPPRLGTVVSDVLAGLEAVVHRCLEKEPGARYADVSELARALAPHASARARVSVERISKVFSVAGVSQPSSDASPFEATAASTTESPWARSRQSPKRRPVWPFVAALSVVAVAGAALFHRRAEPTPPAASGAGVAASATATPAPPASATAATEAPAPVEAPAPPASAAVEPEPPRQARKRVANRPHTEAHAPVAVAPSPSPAAPKPDPVPAATPAPSVPKIGFGGRL